MNRPRRSRTRQVRVLLYHRARRADSVLRAYNEVSASLASVDGMLGNELLHDTHDPAGFVVLSRWADITSFERWEQGEAHKGATAPLREFRAGGPNRAFGVYQVFKSF